MYPFSLSPIYEEDNAREDTSSRDEGPHVPPATEEEQRSVEQQASSILSLLQSVSERLQSEHDTTEQPRSFLRPLWDRYDGDDDDDEESNSLLTHTTSGGEAQEKDGGSPGVSRSGPGGAPDSQKGFNETTLNTPFYEYLRSSTVQSLDAELVEGKRGASGRAEGPTVTTAVSALTAESIHTPTLM